jgi:hypothetical protein
VRAKERDAVVALIKASTNMPTEVHPPMENSHDDDGGCRGLEEQDVRADGELAIAGTNLVAEKATTRISSATVIAAR